MSGVSSYVRADIPGSIIICSEWNPPDATSGSAPTDSTTDRNTTSACVEITVHSHHGALLRPAPYPRIVRQTSNPLPPQPPRSFRNRLTEQATLQPAIEPGRGAWISGPPGCGLSTLLHKLANTPAAQAMRDGVVCLTGTAELSLLEGVLRHLFEQFYTCDAAVKMTPTLARHYLGKLQALLVLDNLPLSQAELEHLMKILAGNAVLVATDTSPPDPLQHMPLPGLPLDDALLLCVAAAQLDIKQAPMTRTVGESFTSLDILSPEADEHEIQAMLYGHAYPIVLFERLCAALHRLPLPLLLVARMIEGSISRLQRLVKLLEQRGNEGDPLTRAVRLTLLFLSTEERETLAAIVGAGGSSVSFEALQAISQQPAEHLTWRLQQLTAQGLITTINTVSALSADTTITSSRFAVSSHSVWQVLEHMLQPHEERQRALAFFAHDLPNHMGDIAWLSYELGNLLMAASTARQHGDMARLGVLAQGCQPFFVLRGLWEYWAQAIQWATSAAHATGNDTLAAWARHEEGAYALLQGDYALAAAAFDEAREMRHSLNDLEGACASKQNLDYLRLRQTHTS